MRKHLASTFAIAAVAAPAAAVAVTNSPDGAGTASAAGASGALSVERSLQLASRGDHRELVSALREESAERRRAKRARGAAETAAGNSSGSEGGSSASPALEAIAACESGGNPGAVGGGGQYRGKYQFSRETWASVGGSGDPAAASEAEQDRRAAMLYAQGGASHWPTCGQ